MRAGKNFLAGVASSCWGAVVAVLAVPYYIKYLGVESYGLIGFFAMMQAMLSLLDMGMSPTMNREAARHSALESITEVRALLHTLTVLYLGMGFLIAVGIYLSSNYLSDYWLKIETIDPTVVRHAIILMGVVIACRLPIGLYQGVLMGKQLILLSSKIYILMVSLSSAGAIWVLAFLSSTIEAFFIWQGLVGVFYFIVMRWVTWNALGREEIAKFNIRNLRNIWKFSVGMSGIAFSSIVLLQLDKILLSSLLTLKDFGLYSLAIILAGGLNILVIPLFNVVFPSFSGLVAKKQETQILKIYKTGAHIFSGIIFSLAFSVAFYSHEIVYLWIQDSDIANKISPLVSALIIGGAINGIMIFSYALQLAYGLTRVTLVIILSLIIFYVPATYILVITFGMLGGGYSWLLLNLVYLFFGTWLTHRYLFKTQGFEWILCDVLLPVFISFVTIYFGSLIADFAPNMILKFFVATVFFIFSIIICYVTLPKIMRSEIMLVLKNIKFDTNNA